VTIRLHQSQQDFHNYEKEHRYGNQEYFEREQRMKTIENDLSISMGQNEKIQRELSMLNEELVKCRFDLEQIEQSDLSHKERVSDTRTLDLSYCSLLQND
jgi:primosomal protein N''